MLTDMIIGLLPGSGSVETMKHYRREQKYTSLLRMVHITRHSALSERVQFIMDQQMEEAGFFSNRKPVIKNVIIFCTIMGGSQVIGKSTSRYCMGTSSWTVSWQNCKTWSRKTKICQAKIRCGNGKVK